MPRTRNGVCQRLLPAVLLLSFSSPIFAAEEPLHARIDRLIQDGNVAPVAGPADDATFVRRIYLDLTGGIPTASQAREFLESADPQKREKLVQQLLSGPDYVRHLAATLDVWLMERRADVHVKSPEWRAYLEESVAENKSWAQLTSEILGADGTEGKNRPASKFYLDRLGEPDALTREVGRIFFGRDLQCAQCHDHPHITDYLQPDYYGLNAFFNRTSLFRPDNKLPAVLAERAEGEAASVSVFTDVPTESRPRLIGGEEIDEPEFKPGEEYVVAPNPKDKKIKWIPKYSRREQLAKLAAEGSNAAFNQNIVNRLWAHMMGRGLVEPVDFHHSANPATHPELLALLADEFVRMNYDIQAFLGELALTETYRRGLVNPAELPKQAEGLETELAKLDEDAKKLQDAAQAAADNREAAKEDWETAKFEFAEVSPKLKDARKAATTAAGPALVAEAALAEAKPGFETRERVFQALEAARANLDGKDKELAALVANLQKSFATAKQEHGKAKADFDKKQKAATDARTKLDAAIVALEEARKVVDPEKAKVEAVEAEFVKARVAFETIKVEAKTAARRYEDAQRLVDYAIALSEAESVRELAEQRVTELADGEGKVAAVSELAGDLQTLAEQFGERPELAEAVALLRSSQGEVNSAAAEFRAKLEAERSEAEAAAAEAGEFAAKAEIDLVAVDENWTRNFSVGGFTQLTPEQLCVSMMRATGEWERLLAAGSAEFDKKLADQEAKKNQPKPAEPKKDDKKAEPEIVYAESDREKYIQDYMSRVTAGSIAAFVRLFGGQAGNPQTDFFATADQALFLENNALVRNWLRPIGQNLIGRLSAVEAPAEIADELYLAVLTRQPTPEETARVTKYLEARPEQKANALQEMTWALLSSTEFRFKH